MTSANSLKRAFQSASSTSATKRFSGSTRNWNLLLAWLAPLLLLTVISLPIALLRSVRLAALVGGVPWLLLGLLALAEQHESSVATLFFSLPQDTLSFASHPAAIALGLLLLIALTAFAPRWQRFCAF